MVFRANFKNDINNSAWFDTASPTPAISPNAAFAIDEKIDDGIPQTGTVISTIHYRGASAFAPDTTSTCVTGSGAAYNFSNGSAILCRLLVKSKVN